MKTTNASHRWLSCGAEGAVSCSHSPPCCDRPDSTVTDRDPNEHDLRI